MLLLLIFSKLLEVFLSQGWLLANYTQCNMEYFRSGYLGHFGSNIISANTLLSVILMTFSSFCFSLVKNNCFPYY